MATTPVQESLEQIFIDDLRPSPFNPRKSIDVRELSELTASIEQLGIQVPLLVRMAYVDKDGAPFACYEIVAGHRRYFAAQHAGLEYLPCVVRDLTAEQAAEIMIVENLQRADLPPLEEADACQSLLETLGTTQAVAAKVGKPIEYITRRLKLRTLIALSRQALDAKLITIDHALLLAKLADAEQERALRFVLRPSNTRKEKTETIVADSIATLNGERGSSYGYRWQPQSVVNLKGFIERDIKLELARAPWDLADASLVPDAGPCTTCPKNTAANSALFSDLAIEEARCTDAACFNFKREAFVFLQIARLGSAEDGAVRISWKYTTSKPSKLNAEERFFLLQVFKHGQWVEAKNGSCSFVRTGVAVDYAENAYRKEDLEKQPGVSLLVCISAHCKVHKKAWQEAEKRPDLNQNSAENRAKREEQAKLAEAETKIRVGLVRQAIAKITKLQPEVLRRILLTLAPSWFDDDMKEIHPDIKKAIETQKVDSPEFARAAVALLFVQDESDAFVAEWNKPTDGREEFLKLLKLLGVDGRSAWTKPAAAKAAPKKPSPVRAKKAAVKKSVVKPAKKSVAKKGAKR